MKVNFWADFTCPFSYIGYNNLKTALHNLGQEPEMFLHAYELNPNLPADVWESSKQQLMEKDGMTSQEADKQIQWLNNYAAKSDLPMNFGNAKFVNTNGLHRLVKWLQTANPAKADPLTAALFHANFAEGKVINDPQVLKEITDALELDWEACQAILASDAFEANIKAEEKEANQIPIETIPYFDVDGYVIDSSHLVKDYEKILKEHVLKA